MEIRIDPHTLHVPLHGERLGRTSEMSTIQGSPSFINKRLSEDMVSDMGEGHKIVGIEILDASKQLNLEKVLPLQYGMASLRYDHG